MRPFHFSKSIKAADGLQWMFTGKSRETSRLDTPYLLAFRRLLALILTDIFLLFSCFATLTHFVRMLCSAAYIRMSPCTSCSFSPQKPYASARLICAYLLVTDYQLVTTGHRLLHHTPFKYLNSLATAYRLSQTGKSGAMCQALTLPLSDHWKALV